MKHGTKTTYDRDKCRCPDCRAANTAYQRAYRTGLLMKEHLKRCCERYAADATYRRTIEAERPRAELGVRVHHMVEQGTPDIVISQRLNVRLDRVREVRRALRLEPAKFERDQWEELMIKDSA